jgi:putative transcriptional regulator
MRSRSYLGPAIAIVAALAMTTCARAADPKISMFLVAKPEMPDPLFAESVILMLPPSRDFPLVAGLIVNKPIRELPLHKLFPDSSALKNSTATAFFGGPVGINAPAIVFRAERAIDGTTRLAGDVYTTLDPELAAALAQDPKRVHDFRLLLGRSQWTPDQLHSEIMEGGWYTVKAEISIVFSTDPGSLWNTLAARARLIPAANRPTFGNVPRLFPILSQGPVSFSAGP